MAAGHAVVTPMYEREAWTAAQRCAPLLPSNARVARGQDYLISTSTSAAPSCPLPDERTGTGTFELHCVLFDSDVFRQIELPSMVIREHLDISLQVAAMDRTMVVEPKAVIHFDNLGTRMALSDMRFFFYRWGRALTGRRRACRERPLGYNFYSEQSMYNWVVRRKAFLVARWLGAPIGIANRATQVAKKLFCKDWDPLPDPDAASRPLLAAGVPLQRSHDLH